MAPCLPHTVTAQMGLLWGSTGGSHLGLTEKTADSWGLKMVLGARGTAGTSSSPPTCSAQLLPALPGFLPAQGLSPALLSTRAWTACPEGVTLALSQPPYSCPFLFLLPVSHLFLQLPQELSVTSRAPARLAQLQAVPLQRCSLLQSWLSPHAAPTSHPPGGCSELCRAQRLSRATSSNYHHHHHRSTLAPRKSKTKSMQLPGKPFLLHCRL